MSVFGKKYNRKQLNKIISSFNLDPSEVLPKNFHEPYDCSFESFKNVKINLSPSKENSEITFSISGNYQLWARAAYQDSGGGWHPSKPYKTSFKYEKIL